MISYQKIDTPFELKGKRKINTWIKAAASEENFSLGEIAIVFCSDDYLLKINQEFLQHDYYTDIITFDYCENNVISGDLMISIDSVKDNASHFDVLFHEELYRVIIHGILHLCGYDDHTPEDQKVMREKEDYYLCKLNMM